MIDWLNSLIGSLSGILGSAISDVVNAIKFVWNTLTRFFGVIKGRWWTLAPGFKNLFGSDGYFVDSVLTVFWRVINRFLPFALKELWSWGWRQVNTLVRLTRLFLQRLLTDLRNWARKAVDLLWGFIKPFARWAEHFINQWRYWLAKFIARTVDLVLHPGKLAIWVVPFLLQPIVAYIIKRRDAIGRWFLKTSLRTAIEAASIIEGILARIL